MTFEELISHIVKSHHRDPAVITKNGAHYQEHDYTVYITRHTELEKHLQSHFPTGILFAYSSNQFDEEDYDIDIFLQIGKRYYKLSIYFDAITDGTVVVDAYSLDTKKSWFLCTKTENNEYKRIHAHFPNLSDIVVSYIATMPAYRLYFVTSNINIRVGLT